MPSSACALPIRSEEHTSELQSHDNLVCRLLLEKKKNNETAGQDAWQHCTHTLLTHRASGDRRTSLRRAALVCCAGLVSFLFFFFFFFKERAPPEILPLSPPAPFPI